MQTQAAPEPLMTFSPPDRRTYAARQDAMIESAPYVAALTAAAATALLAVLVPPLMVLPVLSIALLALGFALAATTRRTRPALAPLSRYVSATLTFLGFGAAFLTDVEQALAFFEGARSAP
jgi:hypothetical protein